jgi:hypothetical protein
MDIYMIGKTAGLAWQYLATHGKTTLRTLEKEIDAPPGIVFMSIGWLAREGKIELGKDKRSIYIWLVGKV